MGGLGSHGPLFAIIQLNYTQATLAFGHMMPNAVTWVGCRVIPLFENWVITPGLSCNVI